MITAVLNHWAAMMERIHQRFIQALRTGWLHNGRMWYYPVV